MNKPPLRVAFPVGIGDCHWVLLKMKALSRFFDDRPIHAFINEGPDHATIGFLKMCPQIQEAFVDKNAPYGYDFKPRVDFKGETNPVDHGSRYHRHWALLENCINVGDYDVWAIFNPCVDAGISFDELWPELNPYGGTDYEYELNIPADAQEYVKQFGEKPLVFYPSGVSANRLFHYNLWTKEQWALSAKRLNEATGREIVVVGSSSKSDLDYWRDGENPLREIFDSLGVNYVDAVGKTNLYQYCAIIKGASAWVGLNSGGGIVSAGMKVPTVMIWSDSAYPIQHSNAINMHTNMQRSWLNEAQQKTYRTLSFGSPGLTPESIAEKTLEVMR